MNKQAYEKKGIRFSNRNSFFPRNLNYFNSCFKFELKNHCIEKSWLR
jgi:hypothetical protein